MMSETPRNPHDPATWVGDEADRLRELIQPDPHVEFDAKPSSLPMLADLCQERGEHAFAEMLREAVRLIGELLAAASGGATGEPPADDELVDRIVAGIVTTAQFSGSDLATATRSVIEFVRKSGGVEGWRAAAPLPDTAAPEPPGLDLLLRQMETEVGQEGAACARYARAIRNALAAGYEAARVAPLPDTDALNALPKRWRGRAMQRSVDLGASMDRAEAYRLCASELDAALAGGVGEAPSQK